MRQPIPHGSAVRNDKRYLLYTKLISTNASARENGAVSRAIRYLRSMGLRALAKSSGGSSRAVAANSGIVPDALGLTHIAARHHVELVVLLAEPHGSRDCCSGLAKCGERNIFLAANLRRNLGWHRVILGPR